jgi:HAD superfamily hydrolase (TIGR01509 family)
MAYLFDLDGTLIDSESAHKSAEVETFAELGYEFTVDDLYRFTGVPYRTMISEIAPALTLDDFFAAHKPRLLSCIGSTIRPFYDVEHCLNEFDRTQRAIVTSSPSWYVERVLATFGELRSAFDKFVCADDVTAGKPDPEPFVLAASRLGADPGHCVAVEDSPNGIASAKAAGCYTVAVRRDDRLDLSAADRIIASLTELGSGV